MTVFVAPFQGAVPIMTFSPPVPRPCGASSQGAILFDALAGLSSGCAASMKLEASAVFWVSAVFGAADIGAAEVSFDAAGFSRDSRGA